MRGNEKDIVCSNKKRTFHESADEFVAWVCFEVTAAHDGAKCQPESDMRKNYKPQLR